MNKSALIYEFNNDSPLFAQVAATELENKNVDRAVEILEHGINLFPEYATAYIIYAQALAKRGSFENAFETLKKGCELIASEETFEFYSEKFQQMKSKDENISGSRRATFLPDDFEELSQEDIDAQLSETKSEEKPEEKTEEDETDELEILAAELENAQMSVPEPEPDVEEETFEDDFDLENVLAEELKGMDIEPFDPEEETPEEEAEEEDKEIVSETLAGIYFAQGNLEEALTIYQKLLIYQPEKASFFKKRIEEITKQLKDDPLV